jgi:hypothetical protein
MHGYRRVEPAEVPLLRVSPMITPPGQAHPLAGRRVPDEASSIDDVAVGPLHADQAIAWQTTLRGRPSAAEGTQHSGLAGQTAGLLSQGTETMRFGTTARGDNSSVSRWGGVILNISRGLHKGARGASELKRERCGRRLVGGPGCAPVTIALPCGSRNISYHVCVKNRISPREL